MPSQVRFSYSRLANMRVFRSSSSTQVSDSYTGSEIATVVSIRSLSAVLAPTSSPGGSQEADEGRGSPQVVSFVQPQAPSW